MEKGTAHVAPGVGEIETERQPSPVMFDRKTFPTITDSEEVLFARSASDPEWAVTVVAASAVAPLLSLATPAAGFAPEAHSAVAGIAARLVAEAESAPRPAQARRHLEYARGQMTGLADALGGETEPAGLERVRAHFG